MQTDPHEKDAEMDDNIQDSVATEAEQQDTQAAQDQDSSSKMQKLEAEAGELREKYLRLLADFDNFRKRTARERIAERSTAAIDTLRTLLPVIDDFDRAKANADKAEQAEEKFSEGVELVYNKLKRTLSQLGLQQMESTGKAFDPDLHEAFTELPAASPEQAGLVIDTVEPGYFLHDKLIRHAKVVVGR